MIFFFAVAGHQKQKENNEKIPSIQSLWNQLPEKGTGAYRMRCRQFRFLLANWLRFMPGRRDRLRRWTFHPVSAETAVRLGDISVIHSVHLPVSIESAPLPRKSEARPAILAARMAFSSFAIRSRLR